MVIGNVMVIVGSAGSFFPVNSGPVYHPKTSCVGEWVGGHINRWYNHGREGGREQVFVVLMKLIDGQSQVDYICKRIYSFQSKGRVLIDDFQIFSMAHALLRD